jgi:hypothetical protein
MVQLGGGLQPSPVLDALADHHRPGRILSMLTGCAFARTLLTSRPDIIKAVGQLGAAVLATIRMVA